MLLRYIYLSDISFINAAMLLSVNGTGLPIFIFYCGIEIFFCVFVRRQIGIIELKWGFYLVNKEVCLSQISIDYKLSERRDFSLSYDRRTVKHQTTWAKRNCDSAIKCEMFLKLFVLVALAVVLQQNECANAQIRSEFRVEAKIKWN